MVKYTLAQCPEVTLPVRGKDSRKARDQAMDQLIEMMDDGKLPIDLSDGFSPQELIAVDDKPAPPAAADEDAVVAAVQTLNNLANLKLKAQELREEALEVRSRLDMLFSDEPVSPEEIAQLKDGFKALKNFAQANLRYRASREAAQAARATLDAALKPAD
ncbi:MAG: hypothetical protein AAF289_14780 [Cyanobacteria bacterium P01_A01_bin.135]